MRLFRKKPSPLLALDLFKERLCLCEVDDRGLPSLWARTSLDENVQSSPSRLIASLREMTGRLGVARHRAISLIYPPDYLLILTESPPVPPAERTSAVRWQIADNLDFPIEEAEVDILPIPDTPFLYAVAARRKAVEARVELLRGVGLEPAYIDIPEMAQRNLAALLPEDDEGVMLLNLLEEGTLFTLTRRGSLIFSRFLPTGFLAILRALEEAGAHPSLARTRLEKQGIATGEARDPLDIALLQSIDHLLLELRRSLDYFENRFRMPPPPHLYILGVTAIPGLSGYLAAHTGLRCATFPSPGERDTVQGCLLSYGAALREKLS